MLFNSFHFFIFLPIAWSMFWVLRWRGSSGQSWLLLCGIYFYGVFYPRYLAILFALILLDFMSGLFIEKLRPRHKGPNLQTKLILVLSLIANFGTLFVFKYFNFFIENIYQGMSFLGHHQPTPLLNLLLPIGLSFHTFQSVAYVIEIYRGTMPAEKNLFRYALYVLYFPQLVAGPIERPQNLLVQLTTGNCFSYHQAVEGLRLMLYGFLQKSVIADDIAFYVDKGFKHSLGNASPISMILTAILFSLQIYFDFGGYSNIARGVSKLFGYELSVNFKRPYFANSVSQFWQRWHVSLSGWFRDYVYIPLGGSRSQALRNTLVVFLLSAFWHGANWTFVVWGTIHASVVTLEKIVKIENYICHWFFGRVYQIVTLMVVGTAWVYFRADNVHNANIFIGKMFSPFLFSLNSFKEALAEIELNRFAVSFIVTCLVVNFTIEYLEEKNILHRFFHSLPRPIKWAVYLLGIYTFFLFGTFGVRNFIYFQF